MALFSTLIVQIIGLLVDVFKNCKIKGNFVVKVNVKAKSDNQKSGLLSIIYIMLKLKSFNVALEGFCHRIVSKPLKAEYVSFRQTYNNVFKFGSTLSWLV